MRPLYSAMAGFFPLMFDTYESMNLHGTPRMVRVSRLWQMTAIGTKGFSRGKYDRFRWRYAYVK
jgi:hypothetical protein